MRTTFRWDKDMDCLVEVRSNSNYFEESKGPSLISDDMGAGVKGLRAMYRKDGKHFDSKSQYRADVKAHGLEIAGNDDVRGSAPPPIDYGRVVKDAYDAYDGNYQGVADRVRAEEQQSKWRRDNG